MRLGKLVSKAFLGIAALGVLAVLMELGQGDRLAQARGETSLPIVESTGVTPAAPSASPCPPTRWWDVATGGETPSGTFGVKGFLFKDSTIERVTKGAEVCGPWSWGDWGEKCGPISVRMGTRSCERTDTVEEVHVCKYVGGIPLRSCSILAVEHSHGASDVRRSWIDKDYEYNFFDPPVAPEDAVACPPVFYSQSNYVVGPVDLPDPASVVSVRYWMNGEEVFEGVSYVLSAPPGQTVLGEVEIVMDDGSIIHDSYEFTAVGPVEVQLDAPEVTQPGSETRSLLHLRSNLNTSTAITISPESSPGLDISVEGSEFLLLEPWAEVAVPVVQAWSDQSSVGKVGAVAVFQADELIADLDVALPDDSDIDGMLDTADVCPFDPLNDIDDDGICGDVDNCPAHDNPDQTDTDGGGIGDICDSCPTDPLNTCVGGDVCDSCPADPLDTCTIGVGGGGGIAEPIALGSDSAGETPGSSSAGDYAPPIAAVAVAAGVLALAAGGWYVRRRWLR